MMGRLFQCVTVSLYPLGRLQRAGSVRLCRVPYRGRGTPKARFRGDIASAYPLMPSV